MQFWKMNGAGNDFILLNNLEERLPVDGFSRLAQILCQRQLSIGADGLMVVDTPTMGGDFKMRFYNADGSIGEMCGNGARCICRYGYENGLAGETQTIETAAGLVTGERLSQRMYRVRLNDPSVIELSHPLAVDGAPPACSYVELGSPGLPHAVVAMKGLADIPESRLFALGQALRSEPSFPKGANVNFYEQLGEDFVLEKTFERGVEGFTYACGTGTGATVLVLTLQGAVSGKNVRVKMAGGELFIDVVRSGGAVRDLYLTGPTNLVAKGEITDEELAL